MFKNTCATIWVRSMAPCQGSGEPVGAAVNARENAAAYGSRGHRLILAKILIKLG